MSDALRELVVSIDFNNVDISKLTRLDREIDGIESNLKGLGSDMSRMGDKADAAGVEGSQAMDRLGRHADGAGDAMRGLGADAVRAGDRVDKAASEATTELKKMGNVGDAATDEIKRGAGKAEGALGKMGDAAKEAGKKGKGGTEEMLGKLTEVMPESELAGKAAVLFSNPWVLAGAAVVGSIAVVSEKIIDLVNETDRAMDRLAGMTGAVGDDLKGLENTAKGVYRKAFGDDLGEVAGDVAALHNQFKKLDSVKLQSLTEGAYVLKDLFGPEVKETGRVVKNMTDNFKGLSETDALDLITFAFQKGGDYADDLMDTLKEYPVHFAKMGISAEQFVGTLLKGAEAGAWNLDKVADAVKEFGIRAIDGSDQTKEAFTSLGFNAADMAKKLANGGEEGQKAFMATVAALSFVDDKVRQNQVGVQLFGTQWEDVREKVIFAMDGAEKAVDGFKGATGRAAEATYDNFSQKWTAFKRGWAGAFADAFDSADGPMSHLGDSLLQLLPAVDIVAKGLASFVSWFGELFMGSDGAAAYLQGFGQVWSGVWDIVVGIWNIVGPFLSASIGGTFDLMFSVAGYALGILGNTFAIFGNLLQGDWAGAWQSVKDLFNDALDGLINIGRAGLEGLWGIFDSTIGRLIELVTGIDLTEAGKHIIEGLVDGMVNMKDYAVQKVKDIGGGIVDGVKGFFGIHSPSRLMAEMGGYISDGLTIGIDRGAQDAIGAAQAMSEGIASATTDTPEIAQIMAVTSGNAEAPAPAQQQTPDMMVANAPEQQAATSIVVNAPVNVTVPAGTTAEDAGIVGAAVQAAVNEAVSRIFIQLGLKLA